MQPKEELNEDQKERIASFLKFLVAKEIRLLCLDYDLTVCSEHTGGMGVFPNKTRPLFIYVYEQAMLLELKVSITTFHPMVDEVQAEVARSFGIATTDIVVKSQTNTNVGEDFWNKGKIAMIEAAWKEVFPGEKVELSRAFLIDDDLNNIVRSHKKGSPALWFNPDGGHVHFFKEIIVEDDTEMEKFCKKYEEEQKPLKPKKNSRTCISS